MKPNYPTLPQNVNDPKEKESRAFQLSLARTQYNYMRSYLDGVPLSADVPDGEKFSLEYEAKVLAVFYLSQTISKSRSWFTRERA